MNRSTKREGNSQSSAAQGGQEQLRGSDETLRAADSERSAPTFRDDDFSSADRVRHSFLRLPSALDGDWQIVRELESRGAEADLLLIADDTGQQRVAKIYRAGIEPKTEVLQRVGGISFEHVVHLFDHGPSDGRWYELLEYVENGSLEDLISQEGPKLSEPRVREIFVEIASAIEHLHSHDVVHRDIKPSNILVRTVQPLDLVLTDFGIASVLGQGSRRFTTGNRTIAYAAPETSAGEVSKAADWWSLGIILVEILTGHHPFAGTHPGELLDERAIMSRLVQMPVDQLAEGVVDPWQTLCRGLLRRDAKNRWGGGEIERWLRDDTTLKVAEEAAPTFHEYPPFFFSGTGKKYTTLAEIAQAFGANWADARKVVERGHLLNWVKDDLRDNEWRQFLSDLDRDCRDLDERIFRIIVKLDPKTTPTFCGYHLDPDGLQRLTNDALANAGPARAVLATLFDRRILVIAAEATGVAHYRDLHEMWNAQIESYKAQSDVVVRAGAPQSAINEGRDRARSAMLLSVLPSGQGYVSELRKRAREAATPELQDCDWFQALGDPSKSTPPVAFLIPLLAPHAQAPAAEVRRTRAQHAAEQRDARIAIWVKVGFAVFLGIVIVGVFLGYNSPENVAARQQEQRQSEMAKQQEAERQLRLRQQQETDRQRQLQLQQQQEVERRRQLQQQQEAERQRQLQQQEAERQRQLQLQQARRLQHLENIRCENHSDVGRVCCQLGQKPDSRLNPVASDQLRQLWIRFCRPVGPNE